MSVAAPIDHVLPTGPWTFDAEVTAVFDNMLARCIPQYELMRRACLALGCRYVQPGSVVLDLGCSRGGALAPFIEQYGAANRYLGLDNSPSMVAAACVGFAEAIRCGFVEIREWDLRHAYPEAPASLTLAILTLQFLPLENRPRVLRAAYQHTVPGGALLVVEKVLGSSADLNDLFVEQYSALKAANGYSPKEIAAKQRALEGVLVPLSARRNEELLRGAGFTQVDCFWRWLNFAGWLAVKD
jgi:tRNA (cmo5U34)-methyltransferase